MMMCVELIRKNLHNPPVAPLQPVVSATLNQ